MEEVKQRLGKGIDTIQEPAVAKVSQQALDFTSDVMRMIDEISTQAISLENHEMLKRLRMLYNEGQVLTRLHGEAMASLYLTKIRLVLSAHWVFYSKMLRTRDTLFRKIMRAENTEMQAWLEELEAGRNSPISESLAIPLPSGIF
jgi:hypothetical protein